MNRILLSGDPIVAGGVGREVVVARRERRSGRGHGQAGFTAERRGWLVPRAMGAGPCGDARRAVRVVAGVPLRGGRQAARVADGVRLRGVRRDGGRLRRDPRRLER